MEGMRGTPHSMPLSVPCFAPPRLITNGHVQTILGALVPQPAVTWQRERLELADGDFLDLDWWRAGHPRLAVLSHGLEGSSQAGYIRGVATALHRAGWDVLAWNMRNCGGEPNRLARSYHSGVSDDLRTVVTHAAKSYESLGLIGFSLGGNVTLKYLGEALPHPAVRGAACLSVPVDLRSSADALDQHLENRIYLRRFLATMVAGAKAKAVRFPKHFNLALLRKVRTLREFDEHVTAPLHGFAGAEDYWARCNARQFLPRINVPTLLINAWNDSFLTKLSMPFEEAEASRVFTFEAPASGGHVGFREGLAGPPWHERRMVEFLSSV